ncbi:type 1 glutamine amidotransferase domain-containing protein [Microbacterium sp.]|uniref:type 1 glutamine amidotransferase domain-containing protein n=1 Tax=Microbacterium sp. TaxID=51671 RepID=UPI002810B0F3|nr:type 1 glutamine amidotransferase domain-containing protein [Microbacterium sp.]
MAKRILHVVTNVGSYEDRSHRTGLWLSELTHAWHVFEQRGFEQQIVSPKGGTSPLEPRSLKRPTYDKSARAWREDPARMALLAETAKPDETDPTRFDAIYFTGGHGVMYDFPDSEGLQRLTREIHNNGGIVSAVCHGYCALLNTTLDDGSYLITGRKLTGFAWQEEILAGVNELVPYNVEEEARKRGALYEKALLPFVPHTVIDDRLVTGQNPMSATKTAKAVAELLDAR